MRGDVIRVQEHHHRAAEQIVEAVLPRIRHKPGRFSITVAGESGSGKSETARALAEALEQAGVRCAILQQDDYFVLPPKSNDARRREDISRVGAGEVRLALLDRHLQQALAGDDALVKPLVIYEEDRVTEETLDLSGVKVLIAEGTYTSSLHNADLRVFINRNRLETLADREKRGREPMDPFIEQVLEIEHGIISQHRQRADVVISRDYDVEL
jgi:uridine kinase